jgi:hypothetical protein
MHLRKILRLIHIDRRAVIVFRRIPFALVIAGDRGEFQRVRQRIIPLEIDTVIGHHATMLIVGHGIEKPESLPRVTAR